MKKLIKDGAEMIISAKKDGTTLDCYSLYDCEMLNVETKVVYHVHLTETEYNYRKLVDQLATKLTVEELKMLDDVVSDKCSKSYEEGFADAREGFEG